MQPADQQPMSVQPLVASNAVDAQQIIAAQDRVMQQQEGQLDSISRSLGTVKNMGLQIRDELDMQVGRPAACGSLPFACSRPAAHHTALAT